MRDYGHWGVSVLFISVLIGVIPLQYSVPISVIVIMSTLLPNKETNFYFFGRRGLLHTITFAVIAAITITVSTYLFLTLVAIGFNAVGGFVPDIVQPAIIALLFGVGTFIGITSHILGDTIVHSGSLPSVKPFWPISRHPIQFGLYSPRHPYVNGALFKFSVFLLGVVLIIRLNVRPIFLY